MLYGNWRRDVMFTKAERHFGCGLRHQRVPSGASRFLQLEEYYYMLTVNNDSLLRTNLGE